MLYYVFRLRFNGARRHLDDIFEESVPHGWLIHNPPHHPLGCPRTDTLLVDPEDRTKHLIQRLEHSELRRADGVLLFRGFEPCPGHRQYRQSWICTPENEVGIATIKKMAMISARNVGGR